VPRQRAHEALARLRRSLSPTRAYPKPEALIPVRHSAPLIDSDRQEIDLHWYSLWYSAPDTEFWEAAVPIEIAGTASLALSPSDQLLHVCTHGTWHPEGSLHWVADAMTVMRAASGGVDWDRFCERARARRLAGFMVEPLTWLRERFAAPIPVEVTEELGRSRSSMIERVAQRAARRPATAVGSVLIQRERYRRLKRMDPTAPRAESFPSHMRVWLGCDTYRDLSVYAAKRLTGVRRA
jgi:hypothetical protein